MLMTANSIILSIFNHIQSSRKYLRGLPSLAIIAASALLLAACSDSNSGSGTTSPVEDDTSTENDGPPKLPLAIHVPNRLSNGESHIGLGPAFRDERPSDYEETNFTKNTDDSFKQSYDGYTISFDEWSTSGTTGQSGNFYNPSGFLVQLTPLWKVS